MWMWIAISYTILVICSVLFFLSLFVRAIRKERRTRDFNRSLMSDCARKLRSMQSFFALVHGHGYHTLADCPRFYADDELTVVLKREGRPAAVIGFHIENESLNVTQLQGLKRARLFDLDVDTWMLQQAESIARHLQLPVVRITAAMYQDHYKEHDRALCKRMQQRYDRTSREQGYLLVGRWWEKHFGGRSEDLSRSTALPGLVLGARGQGG